jgi:four helix bundle protein
MFGFEKLDVWQKAIDYAGTIYQVTRGFPNDERFGLANQLRRSAVSVSSNIAEGSSRSSMTDFSRFLEIAYGSLLESVSELMVARKQEFVDVRVYDKLYNEAEQVAKMLSGLRRNIQKKPTVKPRTSKTPSPQS